MSFNKEEYEMDLHYASLEHLRGEIEYEIKEIEGTVSDEFVVLYDSKDRQILKHP